MINDKMNKRYNKQKKSGHAQYNTKTGVGPQVLSAANATQQALISDGHLTALINSHINDGSDTHKVPTMNDFDNESFEQQAFWVRNNEIHKDQNSMLSNQAQQARLTNHVMSLDEVDISNEAGNESNWNTKSPLSSGRNQGEIKQRSLLNQQMSQQDRTDNDSFQQITGFQPPSTVQQQYLHGPSVDNLGIENLDILSGGRKQQPSSKAVLMQDQM